MDKNEKMHSKTSITAPRKRPSESMGARLGLKLDLNFQNEESKEDLEQSFAAGKNGHLTKKSRNGFR